MEGPSPDIDMKEDRGEYGGMEFYADKRSKENSCICVKLRERIESWKSIGDKNRELQETVDALKNKIEELIKTPFVLAGNSSKGNLATRNGLKNQLFENELPPLTNTTSWPPQLSVVSSSSFDREENSPAPVVAHSKKVPSFKYFFLLS